MNEKNNNEEDFIIPKVCDECDRLTIKAKKVTFYFKTSGIVEIRCLCSRCHKELKEMQEKIKD